ncbi:hypothetical protein, partial [Leuconostoc lactis]|uniref:hypothetical protein n=1 Tax=Leuconostoc lactis TaxID=1246 RepID=UPI0021A7CCB1
MAVIVFIIGLLLLPFLPLIVGKNIISNFELYYMFGADVKIMDRFFRHRELPDSENFSKPGFQL